MSLSHHGLGSYQEAASDAANKAKIKLEEIIHRGSNSAMSVIDSVSRTLIKDRLSKSDDLRFRPIGADSTEVYLDGLGESYNLHNHALIQSIQRSGLPNANKILSLMRSHGEVGNELLCENLSTLFLRSDKTNLIRTVESQCRGLLSDRFRRIDSRPLLEKFVEACKLIGARPIEGFVEDTRVTLRAVIPIVFEPIDYEVMIFGFQWQTSDYGHGAHNVSLWTKRLVCTNHMILDEVLRQIHLGKRLDDSINFSQATVNLDTEASASKLYDTIVHVLSPQRVNLYLEGIKLASETKMSKVEVDSFLKKRFLKDDQERIINEFNSAEIEMIPAGQNRWRLSNAISWIANDETIIDRKLQFQTAAGELIPHNKITPVIIEPIQ